MNGWTLSTISHRSHSVVNPQLLATIQGTMKKEGKNGFSHTSSRMEWIRITSMCKFLIFVIMVVGATPDFETTILHMRTVGNGPRNSESQSSDENDT
ncbi:hypothetical protein TNCV_2629861 [Trichonephila clavipes]|uniref:Uncharacterized protein n=1 Tax=Trichonephila clavipes TaxID=2585209 RepID=A0A8X6SAA2_TRICX|nr:hypothetical protein TNCV_2629861 [Trichonephila clavipes]